MEFVRFLGIPAERYCFRGAVEPKRAWSKRRAARVRAAGGREDTEVGGCEVGFGGWGLVVVDVLFVVCSVGGGGVCSDAVAWGDMFDSRRQWME